MGSSDVHIESFNGEGPEERAHEAVLPITEPIPVIGTEPRVEEEPTGEDEPVIETTAPVETKSKRGLFIALGAGALVVLGVAGGIGYAAGQQHSNDTVPQPGNKDKQASLPTLSATPVATSAPTETPSASASATENTSEAEGFSPSLSTDELGKQVIQRAFVDWRDDAVSPQLASIVDQLGLGINRYAQMIPQQDEPKFAKDLFVDNWKEHSDLVTYAQNIEGLNTQAITLAYETAKDTPPFARTEKIESITGTAGTQSADEIILVDDYNNASKNSAKLIDKDLEKENGQLLHFDVRMIRVGSVLKISSISEVAIPQ